jgi:hypothetical protein
MMTTNKLTKILSGVATLGIATAIAAPAQAATFTVPLVAGQGMVDTVLFNTGSGYGLAIDVDKDILTPPVVYDSVELGDKVFSDFSVVAQVAAGDGLSFILNGGVWTVQYNPAGMGRNQGQLHYQVAITDTKKHFQKVLFDTDISGVGTYKATKEVFNLLDGVLLKTLTSLNGAEAMSSIESAKVQGIKVIDTYGIDSTGTATLLQSSTNDFTQVGTKVPEPGTILGLLAVGGLGMVSRFKKQK